ncbi:pyruvate, phosphate dikinase [Candidatus Hecatella orcuttiae]|jgi:pyruvate,orthophosphate dikinase|uniref:pyruvate, phosphate dikinase n=1 Tax=Candidatus Hecatella orcuttiae TaxID=1935119 RepID=UPI0028681E91|nr:pyruvate, phosphate dikinase [Candidatus Hecatella orcuttiae]
MWVYLFEEGGKHLRKILGGKGADLAEMTQLGLPVPPGLTVTTEACREFFTHGQKFPPGLEDELREKLRTIEAKTGKKLGDPSNPLLLSVRSGAPISMPGMMDTVLNIGLNDRTVEGLERLSGSRRFALDCYRRLLQMFGRIVLGINGEKFEKIFNSAKEKRGVKLDLELDAEALAEVVEEYKRLIKEETGRDFPQDPWEQIFMAVTAVFKSWYTPRAIVYRRVNQIPDDLYTAVNVQTMVFGNLSPDSGTGVVFTRNPSTGEKKLYGEYLSFAQGEDVVAGIRTPKPVESLKEEAPALYEQLAQICERVERHYKDMQDMEFTVEKGKLYMLQTRAGKRTAQAALTIAVSMVQEGLIDIQEALLRVQPNQLVQLLHSHIDPKADVKPIAKGLPASPGAAVGRVVFDVDEADRRGSQGEAVILVRPETTPEDIHGMVAAKGVLTSRGGMTCHAAVVARGMGKPAVVGCEEIKIDLQKEKFYAGDVEVNKDDIITIDGASGSVILGKAPMVEPEIGKELGQLLAWADEARTLKVRANADTPVAAAKARSFGAEGIGLCRTERMFNAQDRLPIVQEMILSPTDEDRKRALEKLMPMQKEDFKQIFREMKGLPVTIRLLDLPLHEFLPRIDELIEEVATLRLTGKDLEALKVKEKILKKAQELAEHNPMLGHRGCRLSIRYPEIYEMQTRAIFEAATELAKEGVTVDLEIMLPLVGIAEEIAQLRRLVEQKAQEVMEQRGIKVNYSIGTMVEVPRAALTADEIAKHAEFFSFGTNDLTQTTFGFSRDDAEAKFIHEYLDRKILEVNPFEVLDRQGVGKLMKIAVELGKSTRKDLKVGICGEHGGEPSSIEFCHSLGLDYVSCSPFRVPVARLAAAQAKLKEEKVSLSPQKGD